MIVELAEFTGKATNTTAGRDQIVRYLNNSASEIYATFDLPGSVIDGVFAPELVENEVQLTLPWQCDQIRGIRWKDWGQSIGVQGVQRRFQKTPWVQPTMVWRIRGRIPLAKQLSLEGPIAFEVGTAQTVPITFTVKGPTTEASTVTETVTLTPGLTGVITANQWSKQGPVEISKSGITTHDVIISDTAQIEVGTIGNKQTAARNILIQLGDYNRLIADNVVEVLYKLPYNILYYDTDTFLDSPILEQAVVWRAKANWETLSKDETALGKAAAYASKSNALITTTTQNQESEQEMIITGGFNPYERAAVYRPQYATYNGTRR